MSAVQLHQSDHSQPAPLPRGGGGWNISVIPWRALWVVCNKFSQKIPQIFSSSGIYDEIHVNDIKHKVKVGA